MCDPAKGFKHGFRDVLLPVDLPEEAVRVFRREGVDFQGRCPGDPSDCFFSTSAREDQQKLGAFFVVGGDRGRIVCELDRELAYRTGRQLEVVKVNDDRHADGFAEEDPL